MRKYLLAACVALIAPGLTAVTAPAYADFNPGGRKKPPPKPPPGAVKRPPTGAAKPPPTGAAKPPTEGADDKRAPEALIKRYTAIVLSQPSAPFPLQRLAQLYRERDGNLAKLITDFEARAADADNDPWPARVALAGIYKQDGRYDDAIRTYEAAIAERPKDPAAMMALAQLRQDRNDLSAARDLYQQALPLLTASAEIEQTRRTLLTLSLDLKDFEGAKAHHDELIKGAQGSLFVKAELGRALLSRGHHERAEAEFRELVKAAAGDNRALAPALRDLGQALAKQKKTKEALEVLQRALKIAGGAIGVRREILYIMTDAFRAEGKLPELIAILEKEPGQEFERLATLGTLYEETGNVEKALSTYRTALGLDSQNIDIRLKLVHLLQTAGELDQAITEYEALIRAAPHNSDFVFQLCETLIQRGDRPKALKLLLDLERRVANDPEVLAAVADFYERVEESDRALGVLKKLATATGGDPHHLIDLGDRYYQAGEKKKALDTWARLTTVIVGRAKALSTLGEVYLDHDMGAEALAAFREAVKLEPTNIQFKKKLAVALERTAASHSRPANRFNEARAIWEELLTNAGTDKLLAREARTHIVSLWGLTRELPSRVAPLKTKFERTPPDLESGRLLAEVQRKLHKLPDAEATLRKIVALAPGDEQSLLALERVLVQQQNLKGAIAILEKLVKVNPKRAREYYQRMAQYAADQYMDDDAIRYAAKAVELSPNDANGHQKLGDMYRHRQDIPKAIAEYRQAIAKNDRLFPVYFDLAELLLSAGELDEADRLFRRVVRASRDDELVSRAARMSMQVNLGRDSLEILERELLPAAVGNPQKPIYRRLLVELYGAMTFPLVQKVRRANGKSSAETRAEAEKARAELSKIGARAVKPLLDALSDEKESQQNIAIEVLAYVENKSAGPSLFNFATGQAEEELRVRAMVATGALADDSLIDKFQSLLAPTSADATQRPSDSVAMAATWAVARMGTPHSEKLLTKLLSSTSPDVRAIAAVGLGLSGNEKHVGALVELARSPEAGPTARAAAMLALGELGSAASGSETQSLIVAGTDSSDVELRRAALIAAARLASKREGDGLESVARAAIAESIFSTDDELRRTAVLAASAMSSDSFPRAREPLSVPDGNLTVAEILRGLNPDEFSEQVRAKALMSLLPDLRRAAVGAVSTSPERARVVADALSQPGKGLTPFLRGEEKAAQGPEVRAAIDELAGAVVPGFVALVRHPDLDVRTRAVEFLASRPEADAQGAVIDALGDPQEAVRRSALAALGSVARPNTIAAVAALAVNSESWPLRVRAAQALGRLGAANNAEASSRALIIKSLTASTDDDAYALVREAAMRALHQLDPAAAQPVLTRRKQSDPEPRVRKAATDLLNGGSAGSPKR